MISFDDLVKVNEKMGKVDVKGKAYAMVNDRVKAFREICPAGCIETEIISLDAGVVTIKATIKDEEGRVLGTGTAQEKETSSFINKTSFIENCETSAVGRALGFVGIGVDGSMASAEEVANAIMQQETGKKKIDQAKINVLKADVEAGVIDEEKLLGYFKVESYENITESQFSEYVLKKKKNKK